MEPVEPTPEAEKSLAPAQLAAAVSMAQRISENIRRAVKVRDEQLSHTIVALLAEGHVIVEDYPRVGKTALARALSSASSRACSAPPPCCPRTSSAPTSTTSARAASSSAPGRSSPTS